METSQRLSPAEFLAQLKEQQAQHASTAPAPAPAAPAAPVEAPAAATAVASPPPAAPAAPPAAPPAPAAEQPQAPPVAAQPRASLTQPTAGQSKDFFPTQPKTLDEAGISRDTVERLLFKYLFAVGSATGRDCCLQLRLSFTIVDPLLRQLKQEKFLAMVGSAQAGDYTYAITDLARERARRYAEECTYFGAAPVPLTMYIDAVAAQTMNGQTACEEDLRRAFSDLIINTTMLERLGPALNSGRGLFLFGEPGNGKTSIAERVTGSFGQNIWIPRCLSIEGDLIRLFDPQVHEEVPLEQNAGLLDQHDVDQRWVRIKRPTVIAGGELTMNELEMTQNEQTKICEAPLQMKSNCGTLVIDDFGRQRMPVDELLNRWIVPLEKRYDFLNMPSGKKIQVPFDQLIIFSTNLEPKDLVDGAFLRRIPYKIEVPDPTEQEFRKLFELMCRITKIPFDQEVVDYMIAEHFVKGNRPFRSCQPRDLLLQVRNLCIYRQQEPALSHEAIDRAVENYFSVM